MLLKRVIGWSCVQLYHHLTVATVVPLHLTSASLSPVGVPVQVQLYADVIT